MKWTSPISVFCSSLVMLSLSWFHRWIVFNFALEVDKANRHQHFCTATLIKIRIHFLSKKCIKIFYDIDHNSDVQMTSGQYWYVDQFRLVYQLDVLYCSCHISRLIDRQLTVLGSYINPSVPSSFASNSQILTSELKGA